VKVSGAAPISPTISLWGTHSDGAPSKPVGRRASARARRAPAAARASAQHRSPSHQPAPLRRRRHLSKARLCSPGMVRRWHNAAAVPLASGGAGAGGGCAQHSGGARVKSVC